MNKIFNESSTLEIDAKLYRDILAREEQVQKAGIIGFLVLVFIFRGAIGYWLKFGIAIPSRRASSPINVQNFPVQIDYTEEEQLKKTFTYKSLINNNEMQIIPQAHYELSGRVIAYNHDFIFINKFFDSAALYDLGAAWGELSDTKTFKQYFKVYSQKVEMTGSRRLNWQWKYNTPYSADYINSHLSHTHIIPANRNVMAAMLKLKLYDKVKVEGELVDMVYTDKRTSQTIQYRTSLSRNDTDITSRGNGACETLYVTKVQIGNTIYQ